MFTTRPGEASQQANMIVIPTLQAKYWIARDGSLIFISSCHEEWANNHGATLETLLDDGWIRIQYMPPIYVYIDHRRPARSLQVMTLESITDLAHCKIVVEFNGRVLIETPDPHEAMKHVVSE